MIFSKNLKFKQAVFFLLLILSGRVTAGADRNLEENPFLASIIINNDSVIYFSAEDHISQLAGGKGLILERRNNNVAFELNKTDSLLFSFFLEGFDRNWSPWHKAGFKEYTNLSPGSYTLKVRFTDQGSVAGESVIADFKVLPVWYFSIPAIFFWLILTGIIIWFFYTQISLRFAHTQYMLEQIINKRTEDLILEKEKSEKLLANVLPKITASEIMEKGKAAKIKYNFVTVLFSDIQGFTKIAEETNPEVLIDELDKFFFYFDSVVERLGIEKIKTIGDAYMCAGGIPEKNRTNPVEVILAAIEMQGYMKELKKSTELSGMKFWDIRIGIHTGTVIAGVVGQKKLSFDIWGDTVNTASRMESSGEAGKINISGTTFEFVKDFFICEHRGKMPVKYKGEIDMYFVNGIIPDLRDDKGLPNRKFTLKLQTIKLQDIEEAIVKMFENEAPPNLYFHNSSQVKSIINQVELLSNAVSLPDEEFIDLKLAALFLFSGYISDYEKPVETAFQVVEQTLPGYGFGQSNIVKVKKLILNSFENTHESEADNILHDARYDYLGRVDYLKLAGKLLREESEFGIIRSRKEWIDLQHKLLAEHQFITISARHLRNVSLEEQIVSLQSFNDFPGL